MIRPDAVGATAPVRRRQWTDDDTMLYALAVGAGVDDLDLTTENSDGIELVALPTFGVVLGGGSADLRDRIGRWAPGATVHGTQLIELHRPLPAAGEIDVESRVGAIADKGSGALVEIVTEVAGVDGSPLFTSTTGLFIRGETGFAGGTEPRGLPVRDIGDRSPDVVLSTLTRPDQALLYRLCGDHNPLHSDPAFARRAGFAAPILHGLCTWGIAARVLGRAVLDGRVDRIASIGGRFSSPVTPGDELVIEAWRLDGLETAFRVLVGERVVIDRGILTGRAA